MRYEQHEDCEKSPRGLVSCQHGENVDIAWPLVQDVAHVHVGVFAPHAGADEHVAKGDPLGSAPHRWHRGALRPPELYRRPFAGDICVQILDAGLRVVSWNTRELLGSTASKAREKGSTFSYSACTRTTMFFVCKKRTGRLSSFRPYSLYMRSFTWWGHLSPIRSTLEARRFSFEKRPCMATLCLHSCSHNRVAIIS